MWQKRPIHVAKEAYVCTRVMRDLFVWQTRPIHVAHETYARVKRGLFMRQKRPVRGKRALLPVVFYYRSTPAPCPASFKRDLSIQQKRPVYTAKEP